MTDLIDEYSLADRYQLTRGRVLLTGIQALARIPVEQLRTDREHGLNTAAFISGYPGSPLGGFDLEMARARDTVPELPIVHQPAVNEELGATSVMGSQLASTRADALYDGVVGLWYGKAPGLDRAGDALRHGVFAGSSTYGGAIAIVGDDPDAKSSTMPSSSDATLVDLHMPILYPGTIAECLELGLHGVAMSRASGLWSSLKIVTAVADGSGTVDLPVLTAPPELPTVEIDGKVWVSHPSAEFLGPRMVAVEREFREVRAKLAYEYGVINRLNRVSVDPSDAWLGIVATGFTYYEVVEALRRLGLADDDAIAGSGIRLLQLRMPVPFDQKLVHHFAEGLDEILVIEEKNPTLEWLIKDALFARADRPHVVGKTHEDGRTLMPSWGRLDADTILPGLRERLTPRLGERLAPLPPPPRELIPLSVNRTPFFCAGCPHNWGTKVEDGAVMGAGTGCHGMTLLMDPERVGDTIGITAMGNEGAQWVGMAPFVETDHLVQNYGDGTYFHSGQLAIQYCIAAGMHMTFKILYNSTVAMTGGQDSISSVDVPALASILLQQGASKVAITTDDPSSYHGIELPQGVDVHPRDRIVDVQAALRAEPGVTILIHDQECAAELRRDRKRGKAPTPTRRVVINQRICEGCGDCGDVSNCLSVQPVDTPFGRKTQIDQASCNFDESCLDGDCPAFMTVEPATGAGVSEATRTPAPRPPDPSITNPRPVVHLRLAGIGGTGVVTVAQILATAAMFDGWDVRGLDQTGLSQKAGPVVSDLTLARGCGASNLVGDGQADVIVAFDQLVGASDQTIRARGADTVVITSSPRTPTGAMISHPEMPYPDRELHERLSQPDERSRIDVDAMAMAERLVGSPSSANILLLGVAVQTGSIPVSVAAVERAIELNGVAVAANQEAFTWGRAWQHDPGSVDVGASGGPADVMPDPIELPAGLRRRVDQFADPTLHDLITMLTADLVDYQDEAYAGRFLDTVELAHRCADAGEPAGSFVDSVARSLHKLLAYKDEYEVARLMLLPEARAAAEEVAGKGATVTWRLHPPALKAIGLRRKIAVPAATRPVFAALKRGKRLRGTKLDPFGRASLRRIERQLPVEFEAAIGEICRTWSPAKVDLARSIAELPDQVRGYEDLKLRRVATYRKALADAMNEYRTHAN